MILKKADWLILKGFIGPYIVSFFIVEFVLVMQFMWKWIDDLLGRGFAISDYLELIALFGVTIIPLSLPLTILLSSVMVYGDMAEHYELSSLKSAGLSLVRIFRPALILALATAGLSIASSNYFKPMASKAFLRKFNNMRLSKVTFALEEKVFNLDFNDHAIYADKKSKDGKNLEKVMIYYTNQRNKTLLNVIIADRASMRVSDNGKFMVMDLFDGRQYQETPLQNSTSNYITKPDRALPINQITFSKYRKVFELSNIFRDMSNINLERKKFDMLSANQILEQVDTLNLRMLRRRDDNLYSFGKVLNIPIDTIQKQNTSEPLGKGTAAQMKSLNQKYRLRQPASSPPDSNIYNNILSAVLASHEKSSDHNQSLMAYIPQESKQVIVDGAKSKNSSLRTRTWNNYVQHRSLDRNKQKYLMRYHQLYCWALVCILLLFIGGPMGAIVRKGGFGYPLLVAIGFYMSFIILKILGERLAHSGAISGAMAGWLPFFALLPFAVIVTYFALKDIRFSFSWIRKLIPSRS